MPLTVIETDSFPTTLQVPAASEPASAPSLVSQFLQGMANRSRWLYNTVNALRFGGVLNPLSSLSMTTPTTTQMSINGLFTQAAVDGGKVYASGTGGLEVTNGPTTLDQSVTVGVNLTVGNNFTATSVATADLSANGTVSFPSGFPSRVVQGAAAGATVLFATAAYDFVWNSSTPTTGTIWKISDSINGRTISFNNHGSGGGGISVQTPTGTLLAVLNNVSGSLCGVTVAYTGGQHQIIEARWKA